ncbi:MAG TPA: helix-turn-helix domain-containing protein [Dehalococcoidia bacterium]|nr:helix-turn-helix domain-containing protein [Dehalococcoidia bacterium]
MVTRDVTTRTRILGAATTLFARYGFKRTTMEDIATESGLSRASLYLQFRNKEDIFRALASDLQEQSLAAAEAALAEEGPLAERLQRAVEAKSLRMMEIAHGSPHGSELMDENHRLCGDVATQAEARFTSMLAGAFAEADGVGEVRLGDACVTATEAAEILLQSVTGLKRPGVELKVFRERLAALVRVLVAGLGAR